MIKITKKRKSQFGTWIHGVVNGECGERATFEAKVFEEPSQFGIPTVRFENGGNVSKLWIGTRDRRELYSWDRGLAYIDECAEDEIEDIVHEVVSYFEKEYCSK